MSPELPQNIDEVMAAILAGYQLYYHLPLEPLPERVEGGKILEDIFLVGNTLIWKE